MRLTAEEQAAIDEDDECFREFSRLMRPVVMDWWDGIDREYLSRGLQLDMAQDLLDRMYDAMGDGIKYAN